MYDQIRYEVDDPVATITLHRPDKLNAMTPLMRAELRHAVARAEGDPTVVGIIITGEGRAFCAGADLGRIKDLSEGRAPFAPETPAHLDATPGDARLHDLCTEHSYLLAVPKPVIAAINGPAVGLGLTLALTCDLRIVADHATVSTGFAKRGLVAEYATAYLLPRLIGPEAALDLLFTARTIDGREAVAIGLAHRAVPGSAVHAEARRYIEEISRTCAPSSLATIKRQVNGRLYRGLRDAEEEATALMKAAFAGDDAREGVRAFSERRPPQFARLPIGQSRADPEA